MTAVAIPNLLSSNGSIRCKRVSCIVKSVTARPYSRTEEITHSLLHAVGALIGVAGTAILVVTAVRFGDLWRVIGGLSFGISAIALLSVSALYHGARDERTKQILQKLDHCAIYLLIAGTYSAFTLSAMRDAWGWSLFGVVWALAAVGIANEFRPQTRRPVLAASLYLGMGWLCIAGAEALMASLSATQLRWLLAGGIMYTLGVPFYIWKTRAYTHVAWHVFVLAGVGCHYVAVLSVMWAS